MHSKWFMLGFWVGLLCGFTLELRADVNISDNFRQVLEVIVTENVKQTVLTKLDPLAGIVAADLIDQVIRCADRDEIIKSAIDVSFTMAQLSVIRPQVIELYRRYPEIRTQHLKHGLTEKQFIAYSTLYYFYSERLKYNLAVSPEIYRLSAEHRFLAGLQTADSTKWVALISRTLIKARREQGKYCYDVRLGEFLKFAATTFLFNEPAAEQAVINAWQSTIVKYSAGERRQILTQLGLTDTLLLGQAIAIVQGVGRLYQQELHPSDSAGFEVQLFQTVLPGLYYPYLTKEGQRDLIYHFTTSIIERWAEEYGVTRKRFKYRLALGGSVFTKIKGARESRLDFTLLDQIRYEIPFCKGIGFCYLGGFIDPILQKTIDKDSLRIYPVGFGWQQRNLFVTLQLGIPYPKYSRLDLTWGLSLGYEISFNWLSKAMRRRNGTD